MDEHFPGSRGPFCGLGGQPKLEGGYKPKVWKLAAKVVYPSGVQWAIKTFKPYEASQNTGFIQFYYRRDLTVY
jgi:hypothetical protein